MTRKIIQERKIVRDGCTLFTRSTPYKKNLLVIVQFTDHNGNTEIVSIFQVCNLKKHRSIIERELLNEWYRKWCVYIEF